MKCSECRFFESQSRQCRVEPPVAGYLGHAHWPEVEDDYWCGRFQAEPVPLSDEFVETLIPNVSEYREAEQRIDELKTRGAPIVRTTITHPNPISDDDWDVLEERCRSWDSDPMFDGEIERVDIFARQSRGRESKLVR